MTDIVSDLRLWANTRAYNDAEAAAQMRAAADEIERLRAALAAEREACAQVLLQEAKDLEGGPGYWGQEIDDYKRLADLIRARS